MTLFANVVSVKRLVQPHSIFCCLTLLVLVHCGCVHDAQRVKDDGHEYSKEEHDDNDEKSDDELTTDHFYK